MFNKFFSILFFIFSLLINIYSFYKFSFSNEQYSEIHSYYLKYIYFSLFLLLLSILFFFMNKEIKRYFQIVFFSLILGAYSFEVYLYLNINYFNLAFKEYEKKTNLKYDTRSRKQVYDDLKKDNKNITVVSGPTYQLTLDNLENFFLSGVSDRQTIHCNENGYYTVYNSDRYGFNNNDEIWDEEKIDYILIGDSFTHGACVNRPDNISSILSNIKNKKVLNLGYGGTGPLIQYATLKEYFPGNTEKIIWVYFEGNDISGLKEELKNPILNKYITDLNFTQNLKYKNLEKDKWLKSIIKKSYVKGSKIKDLKNFLKLHNLRSQLITQPLIFPKVDANYENILKKMINFANQKNAELYIVYIPEVLWYTSNFDFKDNHKSFIKLVNSYNVNLIDVHSDLMLKIPDPLNLYPPFKSRQHFSPYGYKKIAELIGDNL